MREKDREEKEERDICTKKGKERKKERERGEKKIVSKNRALHRKVT